MARRNNSKTLSKSQRKNVSGETSMAQQTGQEEVVHNSITPLQPTGQEKVRENSMTPSPSTDEQEEGIVPYFCDYIFFNILSWIPGQHLLRTMSDVCKTWRAIIEEPQFIKKHFQQAKPGLFLQRDVHPYSARFLELNIDGSFRTTSMDPVYPGPMISSSGSLALFSFSNQKQFFVGNPLTMSGRRIRTPITVPENYKYGCSWAISYRPGTGEYKLIWAIEDGMLRGHFFTRGTGADRPWRKIESILPAPQGSFLRSNSLSIGNFIFWTCDNEREFLALDLDNERAHVFRLPRGRMTPLKYMKMGEHLATITSNFIAVYLIHILEDVHSGKWVPFGRFNFGQTAEFIPTRPLEFKGCIGQELIILATRSDENYKNLAYNIKKRKLRELKGPIFPNDMMHVHTNSLVPFMR